MDKSEIKKVRTRLTAKRFIRSLLFQGFWLGWSVLYTIDNFLEGETFWGLIGLALVVWLGYVAVDAYKTSVLVLQGTYFDKTIQGWLDELEAEEKDDDDATV